MKALQDLQPGRERILRFADMLDGLEAHGHEDFKWEFQTWYCDIGDRYAGCAAGYLKYIYRRDVEESPFDICVWAGNFLGLSFDGTAAAFGPRNYTDEEMEKVRPGDIAKVLRNAAPKPSLELAA